MGFLPAPNTERDDMFNFSKFSMNDLTTCGIALGKLGDEAASMEDACQQIADYLFTNFVDPTTNDKACALVRIFKTHNFGELEAPLRRTVQETFFESAPSSMMKCLTLFGTRGVLEAWDDRKRSGEHQAIPLPSAAFVSNFPMVAQVISQFGLDVEFVIQPDSRNILANVGKMFNVFHIGEAEGNQYLTDQQEFVKSHGVQSVLGVGGLFPSGNLFVVLMFSRVAISRQIAEMFKPLALNLNLALMPFDDGVVFSPG